MKGKVLTAAAVAVGLSAVPAQAAPLSRAQAVDRARDAIAAHPGAVHAGGAQAYRVRDAITEPSGASHVRFDRTYRGLDVLGGDFVVHRGSAGAFKGASLTLDRAPAVDVTPSITAQRAAEIAGGRAEDARLVVEARQGAPRLAWEVTVAGTHADGTPSVQERTVDARTGDQLVVDEQVQTAADDRSLYSGTVDLATSGAYQLSDPTRGGSRTGDAQNKSDSCGIFSCRYVAAPLFTDADNVWGDGTFANRQSAAVDVHYGAAKTWDYYKEKFSRVGIAGDQKGALSRVHYGRRYNNAFWSDGCFCMTYGDGDGVQFNALVSIDVAAHEMSHGVMSRTANLTYSGDSGGLNEANSDIFGTMVEFYANNPADPPDWKIGEEISPRGIPLRHMDKPSLDGSSPNCWSTSTKNLDVHYSSGVGNHFFYLLANGGTSACTGATLTGIGRDAAARIWYDAVTQRMTSATNYPGARDATEAVAGANATAVSAAWNAVKVP